jgi:lysine biosynthesis protein LysW
MKAQCPECDSWVQVPRSSELWDTVVCPRCHTELQLISENPPELDYADLDDEDYDDEYDDEDLDFYDDDLDEDEEDDDDDEDY